MFVNITCKYLNLSTFIVVSDIKSKLVSFPIRYESRSKKKILKIVFVVSSLNLGLSKY